MRIDKQHLRFGVVANGDDLGRRQARVYRRRADTGLRSAEHDFQVLNGIGGHDRGMRPGLSPHVALSSHAHLIDALHQLGIGAAALAVL